MLPTAASSERTVLELLDVKQGLLAIAQGESYVWCVLVANLVSKATV